MKPLHEAARRLLLELDVPAPDRTERALKRRLADEYNPRRVDAALKYLKKSGLTEKEPHPADRKHLELGHAHTLTPLGRTRRDAILAWEVEHELAEMRADPS